jgi:hypothetical protein
MMICLEKYSNLLMKKWKRRLCVLYSHDLLYCRLSLFYAYMCHKSALGYLLKDHANPYTFNKTRQTTLPTKFNLLHNVPIKKIETYLVRYRTAGMLIVREEQHLQFRHCVLLPYVRVVFHLLVFLKTQTQTDLDIILRNVNIFQL